MAPTAGSPATWTMRFKHHKQTTVLHVDPLQSLDSIKDELLRALRETHPDGMIDDLPIPSSISDVFLARPNNVHDLDEGWTSVIDNEGNIITGNESTSKKRKPDAPGIKVKDQCPKAVGLKEGAIVAYKFRTEDGGDEEGLDLADEDWDVVMPSYEDAAEAADAGSEEDERQSRAR